MAETQHPKNQSGHSKEHDLVKPGSTMDPKGGATAQQTLQNQQDIQNMKQGQPGQGQRQGGQQGAWPQNQLSEQDQRQLQEHQQKAWEAAAEREKSNNPATKDQREYDKNAPGMDPANQPAADTLLYKATRLDLEDITGNPGHRGVNPDAPAGSINRKPDDRTRHLESINEPSHIDQNWPQRGGQGGYTPGQGQQGQPGQQAHPATGASINEPPGSQVIPEGAGAGTGEERPGTNPPTGGQDQAPTIEALDPDEIEIGAPDTVLHVHGTGFTDKSVIHFAGHDEPTSFVSDTEVTTGLKPSLWQEAVVVKCSVKNGTAESEEEEFEFLDAAEEPASRKTKRTTPKKAKKRK